MTLPILSLMTLLVALPRAEGSRPRARRPALPPVKALAASEAGLVVNTGNAVRVYDGAGDLLKTLSTSTGQPRWPLRRRLRRGEDHGSWAAPGLPSEADWTRQYDLEDGDDADDPRWADEGAAAAESDLDVGRTQGGAAAGDGGGGTDWQPAVVAAGGHFGWVASGDGFFKIDLTTGTTSRLMAAAAPADVRLIAASLDGTIVALARGGQLYRSRDGGLSFDVITIGVGTPRALAITASGAIFFVGREDGRLGMVPPSQEEGQGEGQGESEGFVVSDLFAVRALASCGEEVLVLGDAGVQAVRDRRDRIIITTVQGTTDPLDRHIACAAETGVWVTAGEALRWSRDRGRSWGQVDDQPFGAIAGVAVSSRTIWVTTPAGVWAVPVEDVASGWSASVGNPDRAGAVGAQGAPRDRGREHTSLVGVASGPTGVGGRDDGHGIQPARWWGHLLPRVDVILAAARTERRRDLRGLILLTFEVRGRNGGLAGPQGRNAGMGAWQAQQRLVEAAERAKEATEEATLQGGDDEDAIAAEERRVLARALEDATP